MEFLKFDMSRCDLCGQCMERCPFGALRMEKDGITADESQQQWWCFTRGGGTLETGVDTTPIADGEHYEITLTTGW